MLNQPAGHLEPAESLLEAALRETLEETGWEVELSAVTGIYLYTAPSNGVTYQRVCFAARPVRHHPERALDDGIIGPRWLTATNWPPSRSAGAAPRAALHRRPPGRRPPSPALIRDTHVSPSLPQA